MSDWADGPDIGDLIGSDWATGDIDWGKLATTPGLDQVGSDWSTGDPGSMTPGLNGGISIADLVKGAGKGAGVVNQGGGGVNQGGGLDIASLLSVLAPLLGGMYANNQVGRATDQQLRAIDKAGEGLTATRGENSALYAPYRDAGINALGRLQNLPQSNISSQFRSLGSGRGLSLGNVMRGA